MAVTFKVFLTLALFVAAMETKTDISLDDVTAVVGERIEYQIGDKQFLSTYNIYRVVERGTKHLPSWLTFDHNSSMLVGTPVQDDVGIYVIRMKALCIDPSVSYCQDRLSRTFHINVVEPLKTAESRGSHTHLVHGGNRHEPPEHAGNTDNQAKHDGKYSSKSTNQFALRHDHPDIVTTLSSRYLHEIKNRSSSMSTAISSLEFSSISFYSVHAYEQKQNRNFQQMKLCDNDEVVFCTSLILHVLHDLNDLEKDQIKQKLSNFISKDVDLISLMKTETDIMMLTSGSNKHIITAGPGNVIASLNGSFELSWHAACNNFEEISDFSKVFQHNIDVGRITSELGFDIIAWFIYSDRPWARRKKRNARFQHRQTGTPITSLPVPSSFTQLSFTSLPTISSSFFTLSISSPSFLSPSLIKTSLTEFPRSSFSSNTEIYFGSSGTDTFISSTLFILKSSKLLSSSEYISFVGSLTMSVSSLDLSSSAFQISLTDLSSYPLGLTTLSTQDSDTQTSSLAYTTFLAPSTISYLSSSITRDTTRSVKPSYLPDITSLSLKSSFVSFFQTSELQSVTSTYYRSAEETLTASLYLSPVLSSSTLTYQISQTNLSSYPLETTALSTQKSNIHTSSLAYTTHLASSKISYLSSASIPDITRSVKSTFLPHIISSLLKSSFVSFFQTSELQSVSSMYSRSAKKTLTTSDLSQTSTVTVASESVLRSTIPFQATSLFFSSLTSQFSTIMIGISSIPTSSNVTSSVTSTYYSTMSFQDLSTNLSVSLSISFDAPSVSTSLPPSAILTSITLQTLTSDSSISLSLHKEMQTFSTVSTHQSIMSSLSSFYNSFIESSSVEQLSISILSSEASTFSSEISIFPSFTSAVNIFSFFSETVVNTSVAFSTYTETTTINPLSTSSVYVSSVFNNTASSMLVSTAYLETDLISSNFVNSTKSLVILNSTTFTLTKFDKTSLQSVFPSPDILTSSTKFSFTLTGSNIKFSNTSASKEFPTEYVSSIVYFTLSLTSPFATSSLLSETVHTSMSSSALSREQSDISNLSSASDLSIFSTSFMALDTSSHSIIDSFTSLTDILLSSFVFPVSKSTTYLTPVSSLLDLSSRTSFISQFVSLSSDITIVSTKSLDIAPTMTMLTVTLDSSFSTLSASSIGLTFGTSSTTFPLLSSSIFPSTAAPDREPELQNSIDHLPVYIGRYFEFRIPENTFMDHEDGNTRNLTLSISLVYGKQMPRWAWLMFNSTSQTLYGIPLKTDFNSKDQFTLVATDSQGQSAKDVISLTYKYEVDITHRISVQFNETFSKYKEERQVLVDIAQNIASFYNDNSLKYLTVLEISDAPLTVVWGNHSLFGEKCFQNKIQELYDRLADANGSISESFESLFSNYTPLLAKLNFDGVCLLPLTTAAPPTKSPMSDAGDKMWIEIVLPALIVVLVIVIVALLLLICCRHRRPNKDVSPSDKPAFLEDRRPIIFPEELEMVDPSLKPNKPLILPSDYLADFPPAVPPHGRLDPPTYRAPVLDDDMLTGDDTRPAPPPPTYGGTDGMTDPPPYRLPPPYFNPHRHA